MDGHAKAFQIRHRPSLTDVPPLESEFDIIASLLPPPRRPDSERFKRGPKDKYANEGEYEDEDLLRAATELVIRLCWARAHQTLHDLHAEKDLLEKAPKDPDEDKEKAEYDVRDKQKGKGKADGTWKLDGSRAVSRGALLDAEGKVSRMSAVAGCVSTTDDFFTSLISFPLCRIAIAPATLRDHIVLVSLSLQAPVRGVPSRSSPSKNVDRRIPRGRRETRERCARWRVSKVLASHYQPYAD